MTNRHSWSQSSYDDSYDGYEDDSDCGTIADLYYQCEWGESHYIQDQENNTGNEGKCIACRDIIFHSGRKLKIEVKKENGKTVEITYLVPFDAPTDNWYQPYTHIDYWK
jgi:hypothetical protein